MMPKYLSIILFVYLPNIVVADTVFVTLEKSNAIAVIDGNSGILKQKLDVGSRPRGIVLSN